MRRSRSSPLLALAHRWHSGARPRAEIAYSGTGMRRAGLRQEAGGAPSHPCATGSCYRVVYMPTGACGAGGATEQNRCRSDVCNSDADCPGGVCGPRGYSDENYIQGGFIRECIPAQCRSDAECNAESGGVCALIRQGCEPRDHPGYLYRPTQLACIYPDGCARDQDCPTGGHCS